MNTSAQANHPVVRVAITGCGAISEAHLRAIREAAPGVVTVAGLYDRDPARAAAKAQQHGIARVYRAWAEVLDDRAVDVVAVLLPHDQHCQVAIEALDAGHHVVVEKPMAPTVAECRQMLAAAGRAQRRIVPVHNRVYDPASEVARELVESGAIGEVFLAQTVGLEPPRTVSDRPWLGTPAGGGGVLMAQAVHPA